MLLHCVSLQDAIVDNVCQGGSLATALQGNSPSEATVLIGGLPGSCCFSKLHSRASQDHVHPILQRLVQLSCCAKAAVRCCRVPGTTGAFICRRGGGVTEQAASHGGRRTGAGAVLRLLLTPKPVTKWEEAWMNH